MKVTDFRIDNYVYGITNSEKKVMQISELVTFNRGEPSIEADGMFNVLEPIPLTEEWLLKFGFEHNRTGLFGNNYILNGVSIQLKGFGVYMFVPYARCEIQYVHQLQNLYYALTNEELTYTTNESNS